MIPPAVSLADASRRLRRPAGRPGRLLVGQPSGSVIQSAPTAPASGAAETRDFAAALLPRGLPMRAAAAYSGLPERTLWRLVAAGRLRPIRVPGCRRVLLDRADLDRLLESCKEAGQEGA